VLTAHTRTVPKGTYVICLRLRREKVVVVQRRILGTWRTKRTYVLPAGDYLYVGSAHGAGGLPSRVGRHLSTSKPKQWDLDFLVSGSLNEVSMDAWGMPSPRGTECRWASAIFGVAGTFPVLGTKGTSARCIHGFGAGDCRRRCGCTDDDPAVSRTHLFRVAWKPTLGRMRDLLGPELKDLRKEYDLQKLASKRRPISFEGGPE
jgi:Uri superfamily endonuclease